MVGLENLGAVWASLILQIFAPYTHTHTAMVVESDKKRLHGSDNLDRVLRLFQTV